MDDIIWDGIVRTGMLKDDSTEVRIQLADAAKSFDWQRVFDILARESSWINSSRPDGASLYAPLHQVAYAGAPADVAERLIEMGAWRSLQNARGERPEDVAERRGHHHLRDCLMPRFNHRIPNGILLKIQANFHSVIHGRIAEIEQEHSLRFPELEPLLELIEPKMWFPVPGMYGGFSYWIESTGVDAKLVSESWCRVSGGSGQRHEITTLGSRMVDEGFV
jgi:hypothetical protein